MRKDQDTSVPTSSALYNIYKSSNNLDLIIIICVSLPWYQLLLGVGSWILGSVSSGVVLYLSQETHSLGLISTPDFVHLLTSSESLPAVGKLHITHR